MRYISKFVLTLGMCVGFCGCTPGESEPPVGARQDAEVQLRAESRNDEEQETMMVVLNLVGTQAEQVTAAFEARDSAVEAYLAGEQGQKLIHLEAELAHAAQNKDLASVRDTIQQATPLREALRAIVAEGEQGILDALTPAQQRQWQGHEVSRRLLSVMEPLGLASAQSAAITLAGRAAFSEAYDKGEVNPSAAAFLALERWAETDVLSPEQRTRYEEVKSRKGLRSLGS